MLGERRPAGLITAAVYCALLALVLGYAISYLLTGVGLGIVTPSPGQPAHGPAALSRAGLNLYAIQHVCLEGSGAVSGPVAGTQPIRANVAFPLTFWALIPGLALMIGGYMAARTRDGLNRVAAVAPAVAGGVLYGGVLALASGSVHARLGLSALPLFENVSFNPPDIAFSPDPGSAFVHALVFGLLFTWLGALAATRTPGYRENPGKWWVCTKAVLAAVIGVQVLLAAALVVWLIRAPQADDGAPPASVAQLPTALGFGYALAHGAWLTAGVESSIGAGVEPVRELDVSLNLYAGTTRRHDAESPRRPLRPYVYILPFVAAVAIVLAGRSAVLSGSRDGSLPTAARMAVLHTCGLVLIDWLSSFGWSSQVGTGAAASTTTVSVTVVPGMFVLASVAAVFVLAMVGAYWANTRSSGYGGYGL